LRGRGINQPVNTYHWVRKARFDPLQELLHEYSEPQTDYVKVTSHRRIDGLISAILSGFENTK